MKLDVECTRSKANSWIEEHALWGPNSQILATAAQSFPGLTREVRSVSTGVENK